MGLLSPEMYADSSMVKANVNNFGLSRSDLSVEDSSYRERLSPHRALLEAKG